MLTDNPEKIRKMKCSIKMWRKAQNYEWSWNTNEKWNWNNSLYLPNWHKLKGLNIPRIG